MTTIERLNNLVNNYKEYKQSYEYSEFYKIHRKDYDLLIKDIDVLLVNYNSLQLVSKILEEKVDKLKKQLEEYKEHLEQQTQKQKEIIDRLKELNLTISDSDYVYSQDEITSKNLELLQILEDKEVE